ncbi:unnamed protein product [Pleuronectes platessa]|uniref:Uncharacterized protein n=1 Tax=Pleuronectes platessa TaxID=8262 RepID=A0A9N7U5E0_PLEPL|nr:unnamed protein product [Pleuronectes platessa]
MPIENHFHRPERARRAAAHVSLVWGTAGVLLDACVHQLPAASVFPVHLFVCERARGEAEEKSLNPSPQVRGHRKFPERGGGGASCRGGPAQMLTVAVKQ